MKILDALKTYKGNAIRIINFGTDDYERWLIWNDDGKQFVVYSSKNHNELGIEIYKGKNEEEAVAALINGTDEIFMNGYFDTHRCKCLAPIPL